jgi:pimeloyl-ACP methyl ester carboxylesterase
MAETIFLIHGLWGGPWCWANYRGMFERQGYHCIATTLPCHDVDPRSAPDPRLGTFGLLDYAAAVEAELKQLRTKPILVGHSMGGLLAQMLAARGLAKAIVLLAPAAPAGIFAVAPSVIHSFWSIQTTWAFWRRPVRPTFPEATFSMLHLVPEAERGAIYDRLVYDSGRVVFEIGYWFFDATGASHVNASQVTCPVLVIAGAQDRITPAWAVHQVARKYGDRATYRAFDDHAHWVIGEPGWEEVAGAVMDWLDAAGAARKG